MKQILIKKGKPIVVEVPAPGAREGMILVEVRASCVSPGTELAGMANSGKSLLQRAMEQPDKAKTALAQMKREGIATVWKRAQAKFDKESAPGYTAAGVVLDVGPGVKEFTKGMRVAITGVGFASHAEVAAVPVNLAVSIPEEVDYAEASTVALGAIAMQGVRRANVSLGEKVAVIGCGALGILAVQMLKAAGCAVVATDLDASRLQIAKELGADLCLNPREDDAVALATHWSGGHGVDAVLVFAATQSSEPVSQAFQMSRRKGRVILVGVAGGEYKRDEMYQKELDFLISTSYGPGRYDDNYELRGQDYPYGYVRWTEKRNMQAYLDLIAGGKLAVSGLIGTRSSLENAAEAYAKLKEGSGGFLAVLEPQGGELISEMAAASGEGEVQKYKAPKNGEKLSVAVVGAGAFVQGTHLPNLAAMSERVEVSWICSRTGPSARNAAGDLEGVQLTTHYDEVLADPGVHVILVGTRHNTHAEFAIRALRAGKGVFLEKPMCLTSEEYQEICQLVEESSAPFMVGYNRRFAPQVELIRSQLQNRVHPVMIQYVMNAGYLPKDHWTQGEEGGGRLMGEGCHLVDVIRSLVGSPVSEISCHAIRSANEALVKDDNFSLNLQYEDGSVANLIYTSQGNRSYPKETMRVFCDEKTWVLEDYLDLDVFGGPKGSHLKVRDKGHAKELERFVAAAFLGERFAIPWDEQREVWETCYQALQLCLEQ